MNRERESRPDTKSERPSTYIDDPEKVTSDSTGLIGHTSEYPLVDVVEILPPIPKRAERRVVVRCVFCKKKHTHGWPREDDHRLYLSRLSHCVGKFRAKPYWVVLPPDDTYSGDPGGGVSSDAPDAMRRRREASQRLPRLQSGRRDPLFGGGR